MLFFRIRICLEITGHVPRLFPTHWPLIYSLLCEAGGIGSGSKPALPLGCLLIAPEQLRTHLARGEKYAFGFSLLASDEATAGETVARIVRGLGQLGARPRGKKRASLAGNFSVDSVEDLIAAQAWSPERPPAPVDGELILDQVNRLAGARRVTLRFASPLRWQLPRSQRKANRHHTYFDRHSFDAGIFLSRLPKRLEAVGLDTSGPPRDADWSDAKVAANELVWLDVEYGGGRKKKMKLGGALGRVTLDLPPGYPLHWLVWGQYTHVGESTRFGLGRYVIEELGSEPFVCSRWKSLLHLALDDSSLELTAQTSAASVAAVASAAEQARAGRYVPQPSSRIPLENPIGRTRSLAVPDKVDRALQRAVLDLLAPAVDQLLESSSMAYRKGWGRHRAARRIEQAYHEGYRWAIRADFESFFDSIDHDELAARLRAYLADEPLCALVMRWVRAGDLEADDRGIPVGAPISPLLANLLLDRFDERIAAAGGQLVRYADDFLILLRDKTEAERLFRAAEHAAGQLKLKLNDEKTYVVDLTEPFEFLGFRFERHTAWQATPAQPPAHLDELGWYDLAGRRSPDALRIRLPGETLLHDPSADVTCILDADINWIGVEDGRLGYSRTNRPIQKGPPLCEIDEMLILGQPVLDDSLIAALKKAEMRLLVADTSGQVVLDFLPDRLAGDAELVTAQTRRAENPTWQLEIGRHLISAKLHNYAALAAAIPGRDDQPDAETVALLRRQAEAACRAASVDELLGIEGSGAAAWYGTLSKRLPAKFPFYRRTAPNAQDPVNVMLNIAQTALYRQCKLAARIVGLVPMIGFLHRPRSGHAALASDFQEPFRALMDRAVIEVAHRISPGDFRPVDDGPFPLQMGWTARRRLLKAIYESFATVVTSAGADEPFAYRTHLLRLARSLRRSLRAGEIDLQVFRFPVEAAGGKAEG